MSLALADRVKLVREEKLRAELVSVPDALTGLQNRRAYEEISEQEEERLKRYAEIFSGIMLDINRFKQVNDIHGHACGNALLRQVATRIRHHIRSNDHARMGRRVSDPTAQHRSGAGDPDGRATAPDHRRQTHPLSRQGAADQHQSGRGPIPLLGQRPTGRCAAR